jgi:hypothetical protein
MTIFFIAALIKIGKFILPYIKDFIINKILEFVFQKITELFNTFVDYLNE